MDKETKKKLYAAMALGSEMGFLIALPLAGFLILGVYLDKKFQTMPFFTLILVAISIISVFIEIRYIVLPFLEKRSRERKNDQNKKEQNK